MTESEILRIWNGPTSVCNRAKILQFAADLEAKRAERPANEKDDERALRIAKETAREAILTALRKQHAVYREHWSESDANRSGAYGIREAIEIILALDIYAAPAKPTEQEMVMVSRDPTWQMCDAGVLAAGKGYMNHEKISVDEAEAIYRAMLAASETKT